MIGTEKILELSTLDMCAKRRGFIDSYCPDLDWINGFLRETSIESGSEMIEDQNFFTDSMFPYLTRMIVIE